MARIIQLSLVLLFAANALAQTPKFSWLRYYQVTPGKEAEFVRTVTATKVATGGKIAGWGVAVPLTQTRETWTHLVYAVLSDWSGADAWVAALDSMNVGTTIVPGSPRDIIVRHLARAETPRVENAKYIALAFHKIKPGREGDAVALFNEWATPVFRDMAAKGRISPWGLSYQEYGDNDSWTHMVWSFMPDLAALDEVDAAVTPAPGDMKLRGYIVRLRDMTADDRYENAILRIVHMSP